MPDPFGPLTEDQWSEIVSDLLSISGGSPIAQRREQLLQRLYELHPDSGDAQEVVDRILAACDFLRNHWRSFTGPPEPYARADGDRFTVDWDLVAAVGIVALNTPYSLLDDIKPSDVWPALLAWQKKKYGHSTP